MLSCRFHCRLASPLLVAFSFGAALFGTITRLHAAETAAGEAPKDHVIFVGLTLELESPNARGDLIALTRSGVALATAEGRTEVPLRNIHSVSLRRRPQLTNTVVEVANVRGERTFTPAANPNRLAMEQVSDMQFMQEQRIGAATINARDSEMIIANSDLARQIKDQTRQQANIDLENAVFSTSGAMFSAGATVHDADPGGAAGKSDAYDVQFTASSRRPVENAYAVLLLSVSTPDAPHTPRPHVRFRALPPLAPEPREFNIVCPGLPLGYTVHSYEVHFYAGAEELATTQSEKAVQVTRAEAFQYLLIGYLMEHKQADRPPQIVAALLPDDVARRVPEAARTRSAEVHVTAEGRVARVVLDDEEPRSADASVRSLLEDAFFFPALKQGQPVATDTTVEFAELSRR
jgi:hypothetical protein